MADDDGIYIGEEGQVVDDLQGDGAEPITSDSDDDGGGGGGDGDGGVGTDGDAQELEDTSLHSFDGHTDSVYAVTWNPCRPGMVATGGGDDKAFLWQVGSGEATFELTGHTDTVCSMGFAADGALLATGALDGTVKIWDASVGRLARTLDGPADGVEWVLWHPRGHIVLAGSDDFCAWMWNADTGATMQVFAGHSGSVRCGAFSPDGRAVVTGGGEGDASLRAWDPKTGECTTTVSGHDYHTAGLTSLALAPSSPVAVTGSEDGTARVANYETGRRLGALAAHEDSVEGVAFVNGASLIATGGVDGQLVLWDAATLAQRIACAHPDGVTSLATHPTQPLVLTSCLDGVVRVWDARTGECVRSLTGHGAAVQCVAVSPDGALALSGGDDGAAKVFELEL